MSKDEKSNYYDAGGVQVIDVIKAKLTPEQYTGYLLGNVIKYACRLNFKGSAERDAEKLANYSQWVTEQDLQDEISIKRMVEYPPYKTKFDIEPTPPCTCSGHEGVKDTLDRLNVYDRDYLNKIERSKRHG